MKSHHLKTPPSESIALKSLWISPCDAIRYYDRVLIAGLARKLPPYSKKIDKSFLAISNSFYYLILHDGFDGTRKRRTAQPASIGVFVRLRSARES
jgi:hypothetical protein